MTKINTIMLCGKVLSWFFIAYIIHLLNNFFNKDKTEENNNG